MIEPMNERKHQLFEEANSPNKSFINHVTERH